MALATVGVSSVAAALRTLKQCKILLLSYPACGTNLGTGCCTYVRARWKKMQATSFLKPLSQCHSPRGEVSRSWRRGESWEKHCPHLWFASSCHDSLLSVTSTDIRNRNKALRSTKEHYEVVLNARINCKFYTIFLLLAECDKLGWNKIQLEISPNYIKCTTNHLRNTTSLSSKRRVQLFQHPRASSVYYLLNDSFMSSRLDFSATPMRNTFRSLHERMKEVQLSSRVTMSPRPHILKLYGSM